MIPKCFQHTSPKSANANLAAATSNILSKAVDTKQFKYSIQAFPG